MKIGFQQHQKISHSVFIIKRVPFENYFQTVEKTKRKHMLVMRKMLVMCLVIGKLTKYVQKINRIRSHRQIITCTPKFLRFCKIQWNGAIFLDAGSRHDMIEINTILCDQCTNGYDVMWLNVHHRI